MTPGEPVVFSAAAWNAMLAAAQAEQNRRFNNQTDDRGHFRQSGIIRVLNQSGTDLSRNSVLGLDSPIFLPGDGGDNNAFLREVCFRGSTPTAEHRGRFCVLLEPAIEDRIARAWISGGCQVLIDVVDEDHTTAEIDPGETGHLISSAGGSVQIVWREGFEAYYGYDTGLQLATIRFGSRSSGRIAMTGVGGVPGMVGVTPGSATVTRWSLVAGDLVEGSTFTVYNLAADDVAPDTWIQTKEVDGDQWVDWEECPAGYY